VPPLAILSPPWLSRPSPGFSLDCSEAGPYRLGKEGAFTFFGCVPSAAAIKFSGVPRYSVCLRVCHSGSCFHACVIVPVTYFGKQAKMSSKLDGRRLTNLERANNSVGIQLRYDAWNATLAQIFWVVATRMSHKLLCQVTPTPMKFYKKLESKDCAARFTPRPARLRTWIHHPI